MNNIIPVSRLGELLSAKTGADVDVCTKFVKEYFGLIEATLAAGEDVSIKGVGTFKLTGDDEQPVIYVVDEALAATVNAPFEAFSAYELADDELTDEQDEQSDLSDDKISVEDTPLEEEPKPQIKTVPEPEEEVQEAESKVIATEPITSDVVEQKEEEIIAPTVEEEPETQEEPTEPETYEEGSSFPRGLTVFWMIIVFILGVLLGLAGGYFGHNKINEIIAGTTEQIETTKVEETTDSIATTETANVSVDETATETKTEPQTVVEEKAKEEVKEPRYDTISGTCYLTTLARKYYGNMDYWVYIYDANQLGNPNRITPGTKVRVPYLEELHLTGNAETDLKAAKQRAGEIYKKFK
jgi:nucleoid-associated protein YgaU